MLLILLLLGLVFLFTYHLFQTLVLILFSAFVAHCVSPFRPLFTVSPNATSLVTQSVRDNTVFALKVIPAPAEGQTGKNMGKTSVRQWRIFDGMDKIARSSLEILGHMGRRSGPKWFKRLG
ncbi:MAG: hypothetical protein KJ964_11995 [Verrucomicrobia bacterium]|nr:hypothetical protein [Verrucomicrobiota bacterium]MBU1733900.1 hypothetical protein [Verrucomicrobiota bacterium]MBU1855680.1 hypothetical protein [Verrucomicrobiota bacterium]